MEDIFRGRIDDDVRAVNADTDRRILITNATVLTADDDLGDFARADILIEGKRIVAVGPGVGEHVSDAFVIDGTGRIAIPGFEDTHRHCWQNQLRRIVPDLDHNDAYLPVTHYWLGKYYLPEDIYAGNIIAALGCLDAGITTVLDFFHNARSADHSDAAVNAFLDAGIRGVHTQVSPASGHWDGQWPADMGRIKNEYFASDDQLLTLRMGLVGAQFASDTSRLSVAKLAEARELGVGIATDGVFGPYASRLISELGAQGVLGEDLLLIHCLDLEDDAWRHIVDSGTKVSLPITSDAQIGIAGAIPPLQRVVDEGILPSLSIDVEVTLAGDMFTQMRSALLVQHMLAFNRRWNGDATATGITLRDVFRWATIGGAEAIGLGRKVGSITPGNEADIVLLTADAINTMPMNNAYGTVVSAAETRNVDTVMVAGSIRKWRGELVGVDLAALQRRLETSRDNVLARAGYEFDVLEQPYGYADQVGTFPPKDPDSPIGFALPDPASAGHEMAGVIPRHRPAQRVRL